MSQKRKAVITGASAGIGKVYADRLAKAGHDDILIARREDRLRNLAGDLEARFDIKAEYIVADLSSEATSEWLASILSKDGIHHSPR